ncbi:hypothetical protein DFQ26_002990 [Actinomortierella ambigua]|nr:hypothetical protein DFQ26_002990 [Actinomortierella ambigua]
MIFVLKSALVAGALVAAALAAPLPTGTHKSQDPCAILSALDDERITYAHVKACYDHIPYNVENNARIMKSLPFFYEQFWAYKGAALVPNLGAPFDTQPVDIFADFKAIESATFASDHAFHDALRLSINKLQDAHSTYMIINGVQSIRVLYDDTNSNMEECQVNTIDGQDSLTYIQDWAVAEAGYSKDPGVRLNYALGGIIYMAEGEFGPMYGAFGRRTVLPASPIVNYTITCETDQGTNTYQLSAPWLPARTTLWKPFEDSISFYKNCLPTPEPQPAGEPEPQPTGDPEPQPTGDPEPQPTGDPEPTNHESDEASLERKWEKELTHMHRELPHKFEQYMRQLAAEPAAPEVRRPSMQNAVVVATTAHTAMYQLRSQPDIGVVVVPSMLVEDEEYPSILKGLQALAHRNVTKIILELSNNGGGYVDFSGALTSWFFPNAKNEDLSNPGDFRVTKELQRISQLLTTHNVSGTIFSPMDFVDPTTDQAFTTNFFMSPIQITRGGLQDTFTQKIENKVKLMHNIPSFPWSNNPESIKILTDGQCGSSCTLSASVMIHRYGVDSYATGGYHGKTISAYSFAGGTIQNWQDVYEFYYNKLELGVEVPEFSAPPLNGTYNVATYEVYIGNDPLPLDYSPERFPAKYQISYTSEIIRHPDRLWGVLASHAWPTSA